MSWHPKVCLPNRISLAPFPFLYTKMAAPLSKKRKLVIAEICDWDSDVVLYLFGKKRKQGSTYSQDFERFCLEDKTDEQIRKFCRFMPDDLPRLVNGLGIPDVLICPDRTKTTAMEALLITLRRLTYPNRLCDLEPIFGRPSCALSQIFNSTLDIIHENCGHLLQSFDQDWLVNGYEHFARAIQLKGAPLNNVWGFIDGTVRPICRPVEGQRSCYNGHKRVHALKYQSIVCPNGLIANMYGPVEGRRHDSGLLRISQVANNLQQIQIDDEVGCIYGDPAYPHRNYIQVPFKPPGDDDEQEFNTRMSAVIICVEWVFGKIVENFAFVDFKENQKLCLQSIGKMYLVAALLTNCHTCLYGSETSDFFDLPPPTLEEYLLMD